MASGEYRPWDRDAGEALDEALTIASVVTLATPLIPIGPLLGQIVSLSRAARELAKRLPSSRRDLADVTVELLRSAARERPVVCIVDEVEKGTGDWWRELVVTFAEEVGRDLPLLLVQGLAGPRELGEPLPTRTQRSPLRGC